MSKSRLFLANSAFAVRNEPRKGRKPPEKAGQGIDNLTAIGDTICPSQGGGAQMCRASALSRRVSGPSPARPRRLFPKSLQQASGAIPGPALPGRASAPPSWPPEWPGTARTAADALRPRPGLPGLGIRRLCHIIMD